MTSLASRPVDARSAPPSPPARRLAPPRWRDGRLVAGVLLVLASVVLGARVLSAADRSVGVVAARADLPAGHVLGAGDLATQPARLFAGNADRYYTADKLPALYGHRLLRGLRAGEFVAASTVDATNATRAWRDVPVLVHAGRVPRLAPHARVDVFATYRSANGSRSTSAVVRDVEFVGRGDTGAVGSGDVSVVLRVPPEETATLVAASETGAVDIALHVPAGDDQGDVGTAPGTGAPSG